MSSKDYKINPPPKDSGAEPLFRVVYEIDVNAADERKAAEQAWQMMRAEDAFDPVLVVLDAEGKQTMFDLSECMEFNKITTGFVVQKFSKNNTGKFTCTQHEFIAGDDVQFENAKGESIEAPEHEYQPFNMTLRSSIQIIERLTNALKASLDVKDDCPRCGAGSDERDFASREFLGIEAIHMHYTCKKCGNEIIEEFTLTDVFIDNPATAT